MRADEIWLIALAAVIGAGSGATVVLLGQGIQLGHEWLYDLPSGKRLSAAASLPLERCLPIFGVGGVLVGLFGWAIRRWKARPPVDPVEANALLGGRLPLVDGILISLHNLLSNGIGASVGLEAGYTSLCAAAASSIGRAMRLRRSDLRTILGCGAAGAIAAAFDAPLAGAFYAFELIIGSYAIPILAPVAASAIVAVLVARQLDVEPLVVLTGRNGFFTISDYAGVIALSVAAALTGILMMWSATATERVMRRTRLPPLLHPVVGGLVLAFAGAALPQILSSGHGTLDYVVHSDVTITMLLLVAAGKVAASSLSIGTGFRGGLFFASLMIGGVLGRVASWAIHLLTNGGTGPDSFIVVGMAAMVVAVIDGPLTMTFLALEITGDFSVTVSVLVGATLSAVIVRRLFGYSFTTWRFHLRGETIRGAHDVGWLRDLTVARMMRRDVPQAAAAMALGRFREVFPLGSAQRVVLVDEHGAYAGLVSVAEAHAPGKGGDDTAVPVSTLASQEQAWLTPSMNVREAIRVLDRAEADALAVIERENGSRVVGLLTEAHALRRYSTELDQRQREVLGLSER